MAYLSNDEVIRNSRCYREKCAVRDDGNLADTAMVVAYEAQMRQETIDILLAGKPFGLDKKPPQITARGDIEIDFRGQLCKVIRPQRDTRPHDEDAFVLQELMAQHP